MWNRRTRLKAWLLLLLLTTAGLLLLWILNEVKVTSPHPFPGSGHGSTLVRHKHVHLKDLSASRQWVTPVPRPLDPELPGKIRDSELPGCRERRAAEITSSPHELAFTGLVSAWRSGNTWVRHLVQQATGLCTTAIYCDKELQNKSFPFECASESHRKRCLLVKAHLPDPAFERTHVNRPPEPIPEFERVVLLVRDPYEFIVANMYFRHLEVVSEEAFLKNNSRWRYGQPLLLDWWRDMNQHWLGNYTGPLHVLLYSRLKSHTEVELRGLLRFLHVNVTDFDVRCALLNGEGYFHRPRRKWTHIRSLLELFDKQLQKRINDSRAQFENILTERFGFENVFNDNELYVGQGG